MSEIRSVEDFESLLDSYEDAAYACGMDGADARDDERKARIGGRVVRAYAALRAENARLRDLLTSARYYVGHAGEMRDAIDAALATAAPAKEGLGESQPLEHSVPSVLHAERRALPRREGVVDALWTSGAHDRRPRPRGGARGEGGEAWS